MALEIFSFLASLVKANPTPADAKSLGDDHLRGIKSALVKSFAGFPGAILISGIDTGSANTYMLTPSEPLTEYSARMIVSFLPLTTNGGASTINISGLGAQSVKRIDGTALANGDIMAGQPLIAQYNGTEFRLLAVTKQYIDQLVLSGVLPGQAGNAGKPLITDGTNAMFSSNYGIAMNEAKGADIASAATVNLSSVAGTGNLTHITGTTAITAITLPSGAERALVFDGVLTLTNSATLILPGSANITTAAGDTCVVRGDGSAVRVMDYVRKTGRALVEPASPGLVLLAAITPTAAAALDFLNTFSSTYDRYLIACDGLSAASGTPSLILLAAQGGVIDAGNNYLYGPVGGAGGTNTTIFATGIAVPVPPGGGQAGCSVSITIGNVNNQGGSTYHGIDVQGASATFGGTATATHTIGAHFGAALSGIRLSLGGVNFAPTGSVRIYGIKKA